MLFNSYEFIFYFLIPVLIGWSLVKNSTINIYYLIIVSIIFYAQWSLEHLIILLISIFINYTFAILFMKKNKLITLFIIILLNLIPLLYYKYSGFLNITRGALLLPLAISFFTFQQIAFQVDLYKNKIKIDGFKEYAFFILFFPQLIAGPIVHYNNLVGQVKRNKFEMFDSEKFKNGIFFFSIGLFSKVVIADSLVKESYSSWGDIFSYSFMIYFDFSAYANMAIGLGLMFGLVLPVNFRSPYKARNLVEFWRRWHITLSEFLKEHIYIPLGGNKHGTKVQIVALMSTMLIGGIWHGAGWHFILWGGLHGLGLVALHLLHLNGIKIPKFMGILSTFVYVSLLWVLFFSSSFSEAVEVYKNLFSFSGFGLSSVESAWLIFGASIAWLMPNSAELVDNAKISKGFISGVLLFVSLKFMAVVPSATFVYFNF